MLPPMPRIVLPQKMIWWERLKISSLRRRFQAPQPVLVAEFILPRGMVILISIARGSERVDVEDYERLVDIGT